MTRSLAAAFLFALTIVTVAARDADADERHAADRAAAQAEAAAGDKALNAGDAAAALARYEKAYSIYPTPNLRFNMALAFIELDRPAEAVAAFEDFLAGAKDPPARIAEFAKKKIAELEPGLARVTLSMPPGAPVADVFVDDRSAGRTPFRRPLRLSPGKHELRVECTGRRTFVTTVEAKAGEEISVDVDLAPLDLDLQGDPARPSRLAATRVDGPSLWSSPWVWAGAGAVVVATVLTIVVFASGPSDG
jgi:hypothetical protein